MPTEGKTTCNDMFSSFIHVSDLNLEERNILHCFIAYLKMHSTDKFGDEFWSQDGNPSELINIANDIVRSLDTY